MVINKLNILIITSLFVLSIIGFMVRLPSQFSHYDKELHTTFYCCAFLFLALQFPKHWAWSTFFLILFGIGIEYAQEFSNKLSLKIIGKRIHGQFDTEDIKYNFLGLALGIVLLILYRLLTKLNVKNI